MDVTTILLAILALPSGAGVFVGIRTFFKWLGKGKAGRRAESEAKQIQADVAAANASVLVVAQSQQQLVADNTRLRLQLSEADARHAAERAEWLAERLQMRREADELEQRMRTISTELNAALAELADWRRKYGPAAETEEG